MIKNLLSGLLIIALSVPIYSQTQFENAGFEEWEPIEYGSVDEPVDWSTIRTAVPDELAQVSPATWDKSTDARTGEYSLYLLNKAAFGLVATGMVTNGRVKANLDYDSTNSFTVPEDARWNTPLPYRPDSVVGWYKGKPKPGDFPTAKVLLHTGYASLPQQDSSTWIGVAYAPLSGTEVNEWTRFSAPFEYFSEETPEFMLTILTSGNGTEAIDGSEAWFDDMELIYNDGTDISELTAEDMRVTYSHGQLMLFVDDQSRTQGSLFIHDISGRQVYAGEMITGEEQHHQLKLDYGIYLVTVSFGKKEVTKKVFFN